MSNVKMTDSSGNYSAEIIADSLSPDGVRLTTFEINHPRFILAEINTHRDKSRSSASSRAIPTEMQIERVRDNPFVPETFNKRVAGMGVGEAIEDQEEAREAWLWGAQHAVMLAEKLNGLDCDKSRVNRLLEPFLWHRAVMTATEWTHFFALRNHKGAQPEMQIIASLMESAYQQNVPQQLERGWWHLPYIKPGELDLLCSMREQKDDKLDDYIELLKHVSVRRCARISWDRAGEAEEHEVAMDKASFLKTNGHVAPFEHVARPLDQIDMNDDDRRKKILVPGDAVWDMVNGKARGVDIHRLFCGNFRGWWQMRKEIPNEDRFDKIIEGVASVS